MENNETHGNPRSRKQKRPNGEIQDGQREKGKKATRRGKCKNESRRRRNVKWKRENGAEKTEKSKRKRKTGKEKTEK